MDSSLKAFLVAAGVVITCIVLSIGFYISGEARKTALLSSNQITELNAELSERDLKKYDGLEVMGSDVLSAVLAIMSAERDWCNKIIVYTNNNASGIICTYNYKKISITAYNSLLDNIRNSSNASYINPKGKFMGSITRDENGVITELIFKQL